jgi:hypothetical protein
MKTLKLILFSILMAGLLVSCEDRNTPVGVMYPEKFIAIISGNINTEIIYDEDKIVAASSGEQHLKDEASTYLAITATNQDPTMTIDLYPPPDHPRSNDIISILIKTTSPRPWARDKEYTTPYINQLSNFEEYAIVSYWSDEDRRDYVSFYRLDSNNKKIKIWREGKLLKGEIGNLRLATFNGSHTISLERLEFELRPEDDGLTD